VWGQQGGLPLPLPIKGRWLSDYEFNLLTITIYAESQNYSWSDEHAIEMIGWIYLNRISLRGITILKAVSGDQAGAILDLQKDYEELHLENEMSVSHYIDMAVVGPIHGEAWRNAQNMTSMVENKWIKYGTGSYVDPTNGTTNFFVASASARDSTLARYDNNPKYFPTFRWAASDVFNAVGFEVILFCLDTEIP
jgi:hypothetical protein